MPRREDDVAPRPGTPSVPSTRTLVQAGGFVLAALATLAVFLTDNPQLLRLAVVAVAWAFVLATLAAGRRGADRVAAAAREAQLRRAYKVEIDREVAARREYELELENELRRETEGAIRGELDALRGDIAALAGLRDEVARVSELRGDLVALTSLRDEVARVAALRDDVAALTSLRQELGQLGELRADMGRLRAELTEQLSSEMLIERIVMRTQASRLPADTGHARSVERGASWADDVPPRELTGGWPAIRLDELPETQQFEQVRVERPMAPPPIPVHSWQTASWEPSPEPPPVYVPPPPPPPAYSPPPLSTFSPPTPPTSAFPMSPPPVAQPPVPEPLPTPMEWLAARSLVDPSPASVRPEVPPRRRRTDDEDEPSDLAAAPTMQRPAVPSGQPPVRVDDRGAYRVAVRAEPPAERSPGPEPGQEKRLDEILAENGVSPPTGGRRRRRYRDEDEDDDVLARVLGRN
jgi:hypothetical protein